MTDRGNPPGAAPGAIAETFAAVRRLPDLRAAIEGLIFFLLMMLAGAWAVQAGFLSIDPAPRGQAATLWLSVFLFPVLVEELVFRGWLRRGAPVAAIASFLAYILWHPLQVWLNLPFARPEFREAHFLGLVATLGFVCTLARVRSGSIWPGVVIHWGVLVAWLALFGGGADPGSPVQSP